MVCLQRLGRCKTFVCALLLLAAMSSLAGCASVEPLDSARASERVPDGDRFRRFNQASYRFNTAFERKFLTPVAGFYVDKTPAAVRNRVSNFFDNLRGPIDISNNLLQGKFKRGFSGIGRLLINTTIGLGGIFDVAEKLRMPRYPEDFGQTFAVWGVPSGPYLMLPILGPSNARDALGLTFNWQIHPLVQYDDTSTRNWLAVFLEVDRRTRWPRGYVRELERAPDQDARYATTRSFYEQDREYEIYDGHPPEDWDEYGLEEP